MKLHRLEQASAYNVREWLNKELDLTPYQKEKLSDKIEYSPFYFYKQRQKEKSNILWRLSSILFLIYCICAIIYLPFNYLITGKWGYSQKHYDNFYSVWLNKIK